MELLRAYKNPHQGLMSGNMITCGYLKQARHRYYGCASVSKLFQAVLFFSQHLTSDHSSSESNSAHKESQIFSLNPEVRAVLKDDSPECCFVSIAGRQRGGKSSLLNQLAELTTLLGSVHAVDPAKQQKTQLQHVHQAASTTADRRHFSVGHTHAACTVGVHISDVEVLWQKNSSQHNGVGHGGHASAETNSMRLRLLDVEGSDSPGQRVPAQLSACAALAASDVFIWQSSQTIGASDLEEFSTLLAIFARLVLAPSRLVQPANATGGTAVDASASDAPIQEKVQAKHFQGRRVFIWLVRDCVLQGTKEHVLAVLGSRMSAGNKRIMQTLFDSVHVVGIPPPQINALQPAAAQAWKPAEHKAHSGGVDCVPLSACSGEYQSAVYDLAHTLFEVWNDSSRKSWKHQHDWGGREVFETWRLLEEAVAAKGALLRDLADLPTFEQLASRVLSDRALKRALAEYSTAMDAFVKLQSEFDVSDSRTWEACRDLRPWADCTQPDQFLRIRIPTVSWGIFLRLHHAAMSKARSGLSDSLVKSEFVAVLSEDDSGTNTNHTGPRDNSAMQEVLAEFEACIAKVHVHFDTSKFAAFVGLGHVTAKVELPPQYGVERGHGNSPNLTQHMVVTCGLLKNFSSEFASWVESVLKRKGAQVVLDSSSSILGDPARDADSDDDMFNLHVDSTVRRCMQSFENWCESSDVSREAWSIALGRLQKQLTAMCNSRRLARERHLSHLYVSKRIEGVRNETMAAISSTACRIDECVDTLQASRDENHKLATKLSGEIRLVFRLMGCHAVKIRNLQQKQEALFKLQQAMHGQIAAMEEWSAAQGDLVKHTATETALCFKTVSRAITEHTMHLSENQAGVASLHKLALGLRQAQAMQTRKVQAAAAAAAAVIRDQTRKIKQIISHTSTLHMIVGQHVASTATAQSATRQLLIAAFAGIGQGSAAQTEQHQQMLESQKQLQHTIDSLPAEISSLGAQVAAQSAAIEDKISTICSTVSSHRASAKRTVASLAARIDELWYVMQDTVGVMEQRAPRPVE